MINILEVITFRIQVVLLYTWVYSLLFWHHANIWDTKIPWNVNHFHFYTAPKLNLLELSHVNEQFRLYTFRQVRLSIKALKGAQYLQRTRQVFVTDAVRMTSCLGEVFRSLTWGITDLIDSTPTVRPNLMFATCNSAVGYTLYIASQRHRDHKPQN